MRPHLLFPPPLPAAPLPAEERDPARGIVFCTYNVRNYLGQSSAPRTKPKPEKEIEVLIQVIRDINPDILGICEMGPPDMFEDFKARMQKAGLGYTDSEYLQGDDPDRHLAIVSRFPIASRDS